MKRMPKILIVFQLSYLILYLSCQDPPTPVLVPKCCGEDQTHSVLSTQSDQRFHCIRAWNGLEWNLPTDLIETEIVLSDHIVEIIPNRLQVMKKLCERESGKMRLAPIKKSFLQVVGDLATLEFNYPEVKIRKGKFCLDTVVQKSGHRHVNKHVGLFCPYPSN